MGKARDGRVTLNFGTNDNKIKVRFANEAQGVRVTAMISYLQVALRQGVKPEELLDLMADDGEKAIETIKKITADLEAKKVDA